MSRAAIVSSLTRSGRLAHEHDAEDGIEKPANAVTRRSTALNRRGGSDQQGHHRDCRPQPALSTQHMHTTR